ncbi:DUF4292 domain-containing protein [Maribacter luteus]|uniref:DUF4292 domain-containing protein n=1 Tax=Maribacter luteus TaxID=2594478 RepID=A0A6I2MPR5_9FLAO|nr:DUF4292 domain-containing protein [Maribacter luteus]MRX64274.1 DUF4292 domain-containing protein [Maribacter luteus]
MATVIRWTRFSVLILLIFSCKSKKPISDSAVMENMSAKAVIRTHYQNHINFKTLSGRMKIAYFDGQSTKGVTVSLRMEKDKAIWISAPLGIVKAYITPNRVSFYNKLENEYFDGDFSYLSNMLGTELDFNKVQNLLLGQALFDLRDTKYEVSQTESEYILKPKRQIDLFKTSYMIEPQNFMMSAQQLSQPAKKRVLDITYKNYQKVNNRILPNEILITAIDGNGKNTIDIDYRSVEFNRDLNFPYKIPKGFKKIALKADAL